MHAAYEYDRLTEVIVWVDAKTSKLEIGGDERTLLAGGCIDLAMEHQASILLLHQHQLFGTMFGILRLHSEALVRGLWLYKAAKPGDIKRYRDGIDIKKTFQELITEYETQIKTPNGALSSFRKNSWNQLNDFTHSGILHVTRRFNENRLEANYPEIDIAKALNFTGACSLISADALARMASRDDLTAEISKRMAEYIDSKKLSGSNR